MPFLFFTYTFLVPFSFPTPGTFRQGFVKQSKIPLFVGAGLEQAIARHTEKTAKELFIVLT